jgi:hypothetical protein
MALRDMVSYPSFTLDHFSTECHPSDWVLIALAGTTDTSIEDGVRIPDRAVKVGIEAVKKELKKATEIRFEDED